MTEVSIRVGLQDFYPVLVGIRHVPSVQLMITSYRTYTLSLTERVFVFDLPLLLWNCLARLSQLALKEDLILAIV